jgi:hypothetical protein
VRLVSSRLRHFVSPSDLSRKLNPNSKITSVSPFFVSFVSFATLHLPKFPPGLLLPFFFVNLVAFCSKFPWFPLSEKLMAFTLCELCGLLKSAFCNFAFSATPELVPVPVEQLSLVLHFPPRWRAHLMTTSVQNFPASTPDSTPSHLHPQQPLQPTRVRMLLPLHRHPHILKTLVSPQPFCPRLNP